MKSELAISSIEERMRRVRNAMVPSPNTSDGTIMCCTVPQPATGNSVKPSQSFSSTTVNWPSAANTKLGTEIPRMTRNMITMSGRRLR